MESPEPPATQAQRGTIPPPSGGPDDIGEATTFREPPSAPEPTDPETTRPAGARDLPPAMADPGLLSEETRVVAVNGGVPAPDLPGRLLRYFGDYELLDEIARGGMGVVYRARQVSLNRVVALKMILSGEFASDRDIRRFHLEAESAANLKHPGIVPIFEIGEHDGRHYFSMAFVEGPSLADKMKAGPLPSRSAASLMRQVAEAVEYAHGEGVIHRDLKPSNILLDRRGRPNITDFGLAKLVGGKDELTTAGQPMGTPSYMPPEQVAIREGGLGPAADVYALGATLYALIAGRPPFQAPSPMDTMRQVLDREPVPPRELNPTAARDLETICLKCLQKEPGKRYASAAEVADELTRYLEGRPIVARPIGKAERAWRWCRRNPAVALSGAIAAALVLLVAVASPIVALRQSRLRKDEALARHAADEARLKAESERRVAESARQAAESARRAAESAKTEAVASRGALARERDRATELLYASTASLAYREFLANNVHRARGLLAGCSPSARGWEWSYLDALCNSEQAVLHGHLGRVSQVQFSPDGRLLLTKGAEDRTILVWDRPTGRVLHRFSSTDACAISASGRRVVTIDGEVGTLHDTATGSLLSRFPAEKSRILGTTLGAGDRLLATAHEGLILVLDFTAPDRVYRIPATGLESQAGEVRLALSPDGKRLAAGAVGGRILLWDLPGVGVAATLTGHLGPVQSIRFSPDGRTLASASTDGTIKLWDAADRALKRTLVGHRGWVHAATFGADGRRVLSAGWDRTARIWEVETGQVIMTLRGNNDHVLDVAASPDGTLCATAGADCSVRIWNVAQALNLERTLPDDFLDREKQQGTLAEAESSLSRHLKQECISAFGHLGPVESGAFTPDGNLASTSRDGTLRLWDPATGRQIARRLLDEEESGMSADEHRALLSRVACVPDGTLLAATVGRGIDETMAGVVALPGGVTLRDPKTLEVRRTFSDLPGVTTAIALSPDEKLLAAAAGEPHALSPSGYIASRPGEIRVWESDTGRLVRSIPTGDLAIGDLTFSPDGSGLYAIAEDGMLRRWDRDGWRECFAVDTDGQRMAIDRAGRRLAIGRDDGTIQIRDASDGALIRSLEGHTAIVLGLSFSPDDARLVSSSQDASVKVWDVEKGFELLTFRNHTHEVHAATFSPDGHRIASCGHDGTIKLYEAPLHPSDALATDWPTWYREDFGHGGAADHWRAEAGRWSVRSGRLVGTTAPHAVPGLSRPLNGARVTLKQGPLPETCEIRLRVSTDRPTDLRIAAAVEGSARGETIDLCGPEDPSPDATGASIGKRLGPMQVAPVVVNRTFALAPGRSHDVRVIRRPQRITAFVDGTEVASTRLMTEEDARLQLAALHGEPGARLSIESIEVRAPRSALDRQAARDRVEALFRGVGLRSEVIARLKADTSMAGSIRGIAEQLAGARGEDADAIESLASEAVAAEGRSPDAYALALRQAEAVYATNPTRARYLTLLGQALYRAGRDEAACRRLVEGQEAALVTSGHVEPTNLAAEAMALRRMGRPEEALGVYIRLRDLMRSSPFARDEKALRWRDEADRALGRPALDPRIEAIKDVVIGSIVIPWQHGDAAAYFAARGEDCKVTHARTAQPGPYDLTVDMAHMAATRKRRFLDRASHPEVYFDAMGARIDGDSARFSFRGTTADGERRAVYEMRVELRSRAGSWKIVEERHWIVRKTEGGRLVDCDAAYWKARDDAVDRARNAGDLPALATALVAASRRAEAYEAARAASERPGATGTDWKTRAVAAIAVYQPEDAIHSWSEAIRLDPTLTPPPYVPIARLDPVPPGRVSPPGPDQDRDRTTIHFVNRTDHPIRIKRTDSRGVELDHGSIAPGKDQRIATFAGHAWVVTDQDGKPLRHYVATRQASEAIVTSAPSSPPPG